MSPVGVLAAGSGETKATDASPLLQLKGICKDFHGVKALVDVDFSLRSGEVVSLIGQNGAGKSTLVSIIGGIYAQDAGDIVLDGRAVRMSSPGHAEELGIGLVHQEPTLVQNMTIAANVFLNREHLKGGMLLDFRRMNEETAQVLAKLGFSLDPDRLVEDLRLVDKEAVEIAKAMLLRPRILILDEVTAPLNANEVEHLFQLVRELKANGIAIIFISHRLSEIVQLSDRIVVLRDGRNAGELRREHKPAEKDIIDLMLGGNEFRGEIANEASRVDATNKLTVKNLTRSEYFRDVSFEVCAGEIVGLAGLKGSGITEIMKCIYGALRAEGGEVALQGGRAVIRCPADAIGHGIGMITNDRQKEGLALRRGVGENITISSLDALSNRLKFFRHRTLEAQASRFVRSLEIKTPSLKHDVLALSGGNQQKVAIAKWLLRDLPFILVDEPTRGVDVKAQAEIHRLLVGLKHEGKGLLISSPEISELMKVCDRILIVASGRIASEIERGTPQFNEASILEVLHVDRHRALLVS
jgi:ribose transport system ATP-binding protein